MKTYHIKIINRVTYVENMISFTIQADGFEAHSSGCYNFYISGYSGIKTTVATFPIIRTIIYKIE